MPISKNARIIRTPARIGGGITTEEKRLLDQHAQLWIKRSRRTSQIEPDKIIPAIKGIYAAAGLKEPKVIIVSSPVVMAFAYGASATILGHDNATDAATYAIEAATRAATFDASDIATRAATFDANDDTNDDTIAAITTTRAAIEAAIDAADTTAIDAAAINAAIRAAATTACFELAGTPGLREAKEWRALHQGGNMCAPFECYLTAMRDVLGLRLPQHEAYSYWELAAIHGGFRIMHAEFCLVCDFPEVLKLDRENRPHCEDGPSHKWRDGWSLYHWHGVRIPPEWIEDKDSLTPHIALTWENIEERRCACEILGWNKILAALDTAVIDRDDDPEIGELLEANIPTLIAGDDDFEVGELLEADIPDMGRERFLRVQCATGRMFVLPVPRDIKTALQAQAWTWNIDEKDFIRPEVRP